MNKNEFIQRFLKDQNKRQKQEANKNGKAAKRSRS